MCERPNILLITTDQQRFDTIAALGNHEHIYTPHLDWLTDEGIAFTSAPTRTAPICMPARATLMTGKHGFMPWFASGNSGGSCAEAVAGVPTMPAAADRRRATRPGPSGQDALSTRMRCQLRLRAHGAAAGLLPRAAAQPGDGRSAQGARCRRERDDAGDLNRPRKHKA
jgi:hypothetical protein